MKKNYHRGFSLGEIKTYLWYYVTFGNSNTNQNVVRFLNVLFCPKFKTLKFYPVVHHFDHSHKKRKDNLETQAVHWWSFPLNLKYPGWPYRAYIKNREKWQPLWGIAKWKWHWGCFSHFLLLWPWCQGFWGSSEDCYKSKRVSQMLLVCYNLLNSQNIPRYQSVK